MKKIFTIIFLVSFPGLFFGGKAWAETSVVTREEVLLDENVSRSVEDYSNKDQITVLLIKPDLKVGSSYEDYLKEIYYFFSTRTSINDYPVNYIISKEGKIYEGNKYGDESKIEFENVRNSIVIGYLYISEFDDDFSSNAKLTLKDKLLSLANTNDIPLERVNFKKLSFVINEKGKIDKMSAVEADQSWVTSFSDIIKSLVEDYKPVKKVYSASVSDVLLSKTKAGVGEEVIVSLKVKNTGSSTFYSTSLSELTVITNNAFDSKSDFFVNGKWDSFSRVGLMEENEYLIPDEEIVYEFPILVPLYPGIKKENFVLGTANGEKITGTEFSVEIEIEGVSGTIIEIEETEIGYLNVRTTPNFGQVIDKVEAGERFVVKDEQDGWYKIEVNGTDGWVVKTYVKVINQ